MSKQSDNENPYLQGRQIWGNLGASTAAAGHLRDVLTALSLLTTIASIGGLIYVANQPRAIPFVIQLDQRGHAHSIGPADQVGVQSTVVVRTDLEMFIQNIRSVSSDAQLNTQRLNRGFASTPENSPAHQKLKKFFTRPSNQPSSRRQTGTVSVQVEAIMQRTQDVWELVWSEYAYDLRGHPVGKPVPMRATVTVFQKPHTEGTTNKTVRMNPMGIYVQDYDWVREVKK